MALTSGKAIAITAGVLAAAAGLAGMLLESCATTPTNVPVQTFEQPQNMDVVCLQVVGANGFTPIIPAVPQPQAACAQVPINVTGATLPYHLFALVTQTTRGEVAVVDLTSGNVVDVDPSTPGINFLPVGELPSDIAATPDGRMVFVGSAAPNAPAIYALPTTIILGDSQAVDGGLAYQTQAVIPNLTTWPVCALPQVPGAVRVLPNALVPAASDGGAPPSSAAGYVIVAVLPGDSVNSAKVVTIDPAPLLRGAAAYEDAGGLPDGEVDTPGQLVPCSYIDESPLQLAAAPPGPAPPPGPAWSDGLPYVDGGVDADLPISPVACATASDAAAPLAPSLAKPIGGATVLDTSGPRPMLYVADTALPIIHVIDLSDPVAPVEVSPLLATSVAAPGSVITVGQIAVSPTTRNYQRFLYAIDRTGGSLMVYDVTDPIGGPRVPLTRPHPEIDPMQPPDRILFGSPVASVAFVQHDWPLTEIYTSTGVQTALNTAQTGLLCNPNPAINAYTPATVAYGTAAEQGPFTDNGGYYRNANVSQQVLLGPTRLRGVFAFATLSNGSVITIDVDDWDGPCRRPDPLAPKGYLSSPGLTQPQQIAEALVDGVFSATAPPQPLGTGPLATDAYHVPEAWQAAYTDSPTTLEWFFPVSAPHRARSQYILRNDPVNGNHAPYLLGVPQLFSIGSPIATQGPQAIVNPSLVPTDTPFIDPSVMTNPTEPDPLQRTPSFTPNLDGGLSDLTLVQSTPVSTPSVRFAWEDPEVQTDQDWTITYEGTLPGFFDSGGNPLVLANVVAFNELTTSGGATADGGAPDYSAVWLANANTYFCSKGIEDYSLGAQRADAENAALVSTLQLDAGAGPPIPGFDTQVADYIQLTDDIAPSTDPYWGTEVPNTCWDPSDPNQQTPQGRNNLCNDVFGQTLDPTTPSLQRDFPILEAYDSQLLIGRFGYASGTPGARNAGSPSWTVVGQDPSNAPFLKLMQCCFHDQIHFNVRTGGQWSASGSVSGFLHHIAASGADGRCLPTCDERSILLNGRAAPVPRPAATGTSCTGTFVPSITRDSVLAMRNPMFSFLIWNGQNPATGCSDTPPTRDMAWTFSTRGQYSPLLLNLAATTSGLSPQTMRFIDSLGQLAIIDGSSQGLILIDLDTLQEAHAPYF